MVTARFSKSHGARWVLAGVIAAGLAVPAAQAQIGAPPPPQVEVVPAVPGAGYAWQPGHWAWNGSAGRYTWLRGHYVMAPRPGIAWVAGHWRPSPRGWVWVRGHWAN